MTLSARPGTHDILCLIPAISSPTAGDALAFALRHNKDCFQIFPALRFAKIILTSALILEDWSKWFAFLSTQNPMPPIRLMLFLVIY